MGGPRGVAHFGAIEALKRHGVSISGVVGNSMGSLVGGLYASNPKADTTRRFHGLMDAYATQSKTDGAEAASLLGVLGLLAFGPAGALAGGAMGAASAGQLSHRRLVTALDIYLHAATIEGLPIPYRTAYIESTGTGVRAVEVSSGSLAKAIGYSIANPLIFTEIDPRAGGPIDPGIDRIAAVPVEQACAAFPKHRLVVSNVTGSRAYSSSAMRCPVFEVLVEAGADADRAFEDPKALAAAASRGREAFEHWLGSSEGADFLSSAERTTPIEPSMPVAEPQPLSKFRDRTWEATAGGVEVFVANGALQGVRGMSPADDTCGPGYYDAIAVVSDLRYAADGITPVGFGAMRVDGARIDFQLVDRSRDLPLELQRWHNIVRPGQWLEVGYFKCAGQWRANSVVIHTRSE